MPLNQTNTSLLTLIHDDEAQLRFAPVDAADNPESVAFNISFTWNMPFQNHEFAIRECWFLAQALGNFESQLAELIESPHGAVFLNNMDDRPILNVSMDGNTAQLTFSIADTSGISDLKFTIRTYASQIEGVYNHLRDYPKWW